jgi:signal peptidase II
MKKHPFYFLLISVLVVAIDQVSKFAVRHFMFERQVSVIGDFFNLTHVQNPGAAFSISFSSVLFNRIFFSVVTFVMIFVILYMLKQSKSFWERLSYSFIIGGALGNLIDRLRLGSVTDFLDFYFFNIFGLERWPVFNFADSSIVVAVIMLLVYVLFFENRKTKQEVEQPKGVPQEVELERAGNK